MTGFCTGKMVFKVGCISWTRYMEFGACEFGICTILLHTIGHICNE